MLIATCCVSKGETVSMSKLICVKNETIISDLAAGADPENFSGGGGVQPLTYNCGSTKISKITIYFIFSKSGDIKLYKCQGRGNPDPPPPL